MWEKKNEGKVTRIKENNKKEAKEGKQQNKTVKGLKQSKTN